MSNEYTRMYREKLRSADEAMQCVKSGNYVDYGFFNGKPVACDRALAARREELSDVIITSAVTLPPVPEVVMKDPKGEVFTYCDFHFSPVTRIMQDLRPNVFYNPIMFGECESYFDTKKDDPQKIGSNFRDVFVVQTAPMDDNGYFNFGLHNAITYVQAMTSKKVVIEVNEKIPICLGGARESIHISDVTYVVEGDNQLLAQLPEVESSDVDRQIAEHVIEHLSDGCCIQLGIGSMPNALGKMINDTDLKNLGGHTEMLVDSFMDMWLSGKMNGSKKSINRGKIVYTFGLGSQKLYDFMHKNPALSSYNVDYANHPMVIAQIDNLVSINQALQVDLYSQINAESTGNKQISGNGGMTDYVNGAFWSKGGRSLICLPSTHTTKDGKVISRIVPQFEPGTITTISRQMVNIIVTEYGWVSLKGDSSWARAEKLISIAHPDFRDDLIKAAEVQKLWRKTNKIPA